MNSAVSLLQGLTSNSALARADRLPSNLLKRRAGQRRQMLGVQAGSYSLRQLVLLVYCYASTISIAIPSAYFVSSLTLGGFFVALSDTPVHTPIEENPHTLLP